MADLLPTGLFKVKRTQADAWHNLPVPAEGGVSYEIQTTVDNARNANNTMIGNPVGTDKLKINIKYPPLTDSELNSIMSLFDREQGGSFFVYVNYYDPRIQSRRTSYMYVGDRSFEPWIVPSVNTGVPKRWVNCQCNLIEC
jgi:hypothetical protein